MSDTIPCSFTLPRALLSRLDAVAEAEDRSRSAVVRRTLDRALAEHAAVLAEADRRFRAVQTGTGAGLPGEQSERP